MLSPSFAVKKVLQFYPVVLSVEFTSAFIVSCFVASGDEPEQEVPLPEAGGLVSMVRCSDLVTLGGSFTGVCCGHSINWDSDEAFE